MAARQYDSGDLDAILELEGSPGYRLVVERINAELDRQRAEIERPSDWGVTNMFRGQVKALRTVLAIPGILKGEIKASLKE